ncbi:DNA-deoxyinosine glycosylase [Lysinibacillus sp. KU-BSD001]|uniref:DNA-deoxyinosine glycosylase n=1 Tax=Lysinibacillus sp. KU-BSD001 TaxID=3141328 RepID=UPI0036EADD2A
MIKNMLPPVVNEQTTVLIVGSMPGVKSLEKQQYYGNPRNHFWGIIGELTSTMVPEQYEERLALVKKHGIGLWDVIQACERAGSLDSNIKNEIPNDFVALFKRYPQIQAVFFNGTKAYDVFQKKLGFELLVGKEYYKMPSTSPVPGRNIKTFDQKVEAWRALEQYMIRGE